MKNHLLSAEEVKSMLGVNDFRALKKDKLIEFVSAIPYMDKDVAIKVIEQFPAFSEYAQAMVSHFATLLESVVESNTSSVNRVFAAYESTLSLLKDLANRTDATPEERRIFAEMSIQVADRMASLDVQNKDFLKTLLNIGAWVFGGGLIICAAIFGVNVRVSKLPKFPA